MVKQAAVVLLALGIAGQVSAYERRDRDVLARFDGGIGVIPVSNGAGPRTSGNGTWFAAGIPELGND